MNEVGYLKGDYSWYLIDMRKIIAVVVVILILGSVSNCEDPVSEKNVAKEPVVDDGKQKDKAVKEEVENGESNQSLKSKDVGQK